MMIALCNHEWDCNPIPTSFCSIADKKLQKALNRKAGDSFELSAIAHNEADIKSGNDISPDFRCKKCGATKEVDHITRDENEVGQSTCISSTNPSDILQQYQTGAKQWRQEATFKCR